MHHSTRVSRVGASLALLVVAAIIVSGCESSSESSTPRTGREIYVESCQTCHGRSGEGFVGPSLIDSAARYPNVADELAVVTNGKGEMPAWGGRLTAEQIATVVAYTREAFTSSSTTEPFVGPQLTTTTTP